MIGCLHQPEERAMEITKLQQVEMNGKTYNLVWYGDKARISVLTKKRIAYFEWSRKAEPL